MSSKKPKIYFLGVSILIGVSFILSTKTALGIPATFNLQGRVLSQSGQDVPDGTYPMTFRIYTTFYGGSPVWEEEWSNATSLVSVKDSLFSVTLGTFQSLSDVDFSSGNFYLSIEFNHDGEMSPRKKLSSVPFSLFTSSLNDKISTDFVLKKGDTMLGNLNLDKHNLTTTGKVVAGEFWKGSTSLDDIYLKLTGGSITGDVSLTGKLTIGSGLTVSSGTITLPSASIASAALPTTTSYLGPSIESSEITDGTIVNADISNTAAIAYSKLNIPDNSLTIAKTSGLQTALDSKLNLSGGTLTGPVAVSGVSGLTDSDIPDDLTINSTKPITVTGASNQLKLAYDSDIYSRLYTNSLGELIITDLVTLQATRLFLADATVPQADHGIYIYKRIGSGNYYGLYNLLYKHTTGAGAVYGVYNKVQDTTATLPEQPSTAYGVYNELTAGMLDPFTGTAYGVETVSTADSTSGGTLYAYASDLTAGSATKYNLYLKGAPNYLYNEGGEQLRLLYNDDIYFKTRVDSFGAVWWGIVGGMAPAFVFQDDAYFQTKATFSGQVVFPTTTRHIALSAKDCEIDTGAPTPTAVGKFPVWRFPDGQTNAIHCAFDIPDDWSSGTNMTLKIVYSGTVSDLFGSPSVKWDLAGNAPSLETDITSANAFSGSTTYNGPWMTNVRKVSAGITISTSGWTADNTSIAIKIGRDTGTDNYTGNADIHLIQVWYTSKTPKSS